VPFFFRIEVLARWRTNAPNIEKTLRVALSTDFCTAARSKKPRLAASKLMPIMRHLHIR